MNILNLDYTKKKDVVAMGRASVDFVPEEYGPVETVSKYKKFVGGSPANTAIAIALQGLSAGFIGKVGNDLLGKYVKSYMARKGVDVSHINICYRKNVSTGFSISQIIKPAIKTSSLYRSNVADLYISTTEIDEKYISQFKILLISGTSLSASPAREAVLLAIEYAKRNNVCIVFDPDYRALSWDSLEEAATYYWLVAKKADSIIATREEYNIVEHFMLRDNLDDKKTADLFFSQGASMICVKHGEDGARLFTREGIYPVAAFPSKVISETGAGDTFSGTLISCIIQGNSIDHSLKYASAAAALTVSGRSCSGHTPKPKQINEFINLCDNGHAEKWDWGRWAEEGSENNNCKNNIKQFTKK